MNWIREIVSIITPVTSDAVTKGGNVLIFVITLDFWLALKV
jgi:hypothetical protein